MVLGWEGWDLWTLLPFGFWPPQSRGQYCGTHPDSCRQASSPPFRRRFFLLKRRFFWSGLEMVLVGGFNPIPLKHMIVKMGSSSPNRAEHKKIFELPPPRVGFFPRLNSKPETKQVGRYIPFCSPSRPWNKWSFPKKDHYFSRDL